MSYRFIILFSIYVFSFAHQGRLFAQQGLPLIKNYTPEEYKGGIQNWQILQDEKGVIYVANNFGLLQYNGNDWRTYAISGPIKLRSIALNTDGRIYAGLQGGFGYFEPDSIGSLTYFSLKELVSEEYRDIDETWKTYIINNKVYFCTFDHIYVYDQNRINVIEYGKGLDISFSSNGELYTHIPNQGLHVIENNQVSKVSFTPFFSDKIVSGVISYDLEEFLITTKSKGIYLTDGTNVQPFNEKLNNLFSSTFINCAILLSNGNIALGTQHSGVYIIDREGNILLHVDKKGGLMSRTILSLHEDLNSNLWIGQNNGISFVELKSPFLQISEKAGLQGTGYAALQKDNQLYLGTNNGLFVSQETTMDLIKGSEGQVYSLQLINEDILMGHNKGAFILDNGEVSTIDNSVGTWMFLEFQDKLLQGTYEGIKILDASSFEELDRINNLDESSRILLKENDSTFWMSHVYKGIYRIQLDSEVTHNTKVDYFNKDNGLPTNILNTVHLIDGEIAISTEKGIYGFDSQTGEFFINELLNEYLSEHQVTAMKSDIYGNIYFVTTETAGFLEKKGNNKYHKYVGQFNQIRKLLNDDLPNISIIGPNRVLFGAKEGFILFDRNLFWTTEREVFHTIIQEVRCDGNESVLLHEGSLKSRQVEKVSDKKNYPEVPYNNNTLSFYFSSTSFSSITMPEFQYKLLGFDKDWQEWTESNYKEYTNLREGLYTFQVKSRNANNIESDVESYSFIIIYPWYRSPIAYIIYVLIGLSLLIGIVQSLNKRHQLEKKKLEQKRIHELSEKEKQLDSITKKSEDEISQLKNEKLKSEIRHMNTELATNTMHLLNKNEFINRMKSTLGGVVKKSSNQEVKTLLRKVIKDIEINIKTDGDWEHFQIHFDKVHGDFSQRIKGEFPALSPQEIKLSAYLRLNLSTKEIANLLNISVRGVEISRYRLRKKLNLDRTQNLAEFILNY